jgi:hypothetical protein
VQIIEVKIYNNAIKAKTDVKIPLTEARKSSVHGTDKNNDFFSLYALLRSLA